MGGCTAASDYRIQDLAKTDIDVVADIHLEQATALLKTLTRKLYKMNSKELAKLQGATIDSQIAYIFQCPPAPPPDVLHSKSGTDAILLAFDPEFRRGDRVLALMYGLYTMVHQSYGNNCELYMNDFLDPQSLYNSARNIEILVWRLNNRHNANGLPFLATNQVVGPVKNLSFERLFGKLISLQDTMARIVSSQSGRMITEVVHRAAGMAFIPIGL